LRAIFGAEPADILGDRFEFGDGVLPV
jgi:hypothetical protein